jgi:hypothetical protein
MVICIALIISELIVLDIKILHLHLTSIELHRLRFGGKMITDS